MSESQDGSFEESVSSVLLEHSEKILENREHIELTLHENINNVERVIDQDLLLTVLSRSIGKFEQEEPEKIARALVLGIVKWNSSLRDNIDTSNFSDEFINFMFEMNVLYEGELDRIGRRPFEGRRFYSSIDTDLVIRKGNTVGFSHQLEIDYSEEIEIHTDIESEFRLINHLLKNQKRALQELDEKALQNWSSSHLEVVQNTLNDLIDEHNELVERVSDEGEIEEADD
ncbi:hypothetical protein [Natronococcus roseus]|uniref:hypothetical protein n=1 Tax=Natronococcus roseus TaxID=1052014 RepID=UPI00374CC19A